ncbi:hypothetical protein F5X96DRAFT_651160 [Biscogniauxia mediterranea]|nr:hypothetical protein F5X96DRAFT_651160 [Biscogniauxia mediterranea]
MCLGLVVSGWVTVLLVSNVVADQSTLAAANTEAKADFAMLRFHCGRAKADKKSLTFVHYIDNTIHNTQHTAQHNTRKTINLNRSALWTLHVLPRWHNRASAALLLPS